MGYVIGIDQGATKTLAAVSDEHGNIIAVSRAGGTEHHFSGLNCQIGFVDEVCRDLLEKTGIALDEVDMIFGGLTGVDWPGEAEIMQHEIRKLGFCDEVFVVNDSIVAFKGGSAGSFGAGICAGTGVNCAVISPDGSEFIYGFFIENEVQGSLALSRSVLNAVYKSHVGRLGMTKLSGKVQSKFGISDVETLLRQDVEGKLEQDKVRSLTIDLFEAASDGDGDMVSADIIRRFGAELASIVNARLKLFSMENLEFDVVVSGSIFKGPGTLLIDAVKVEINAVCPGANVINALYEPVVGAVILALEKCHRSKNGHIMDNIEQSCRRLGLHRF